MLCETEIINKNPKYRVIKYDDEYLMVDVISTWLVYFFPFINWFIPKRCAKISREEYEKLNTVKPVKNKTFWPVAGGTILLGVTSRKYIHLLNIQLEKRSVIIICFVVFLCILIFFVLLNRKLKLKVFDNKKRRTKNNFSTNIKKCCSYIIWLFVDWRHVNISFKHVADIRKPEFNNIYRLGYGVNVVFLDEYNTHCQ